MSETTGTDTAELLRLRETAYLLALRVTGSEALAEDAVQDAYVKALAYLRTRRLAEETRPWFLRVVANAARDVRRSEARRRRREDAVSREPVHSGARRVEARAALRGALRLLDEKWRVPISLRYESGLSHAEIAAVLGVPKGTVDTRMARGLARLRRMVERMGLALAPAALLETFAAGPLDAAPASLAAAVARAEAAAATAPSTGLGTGALTGFTLKGGLAMKMVAGAALAGAVAAGVAVVSGAGGSGPPAEKLSKFATPVTAPGAEWENKGLWAGIGNHAMGYLEGPRREAQSYTSPRPGVFTEDGGENIFRTYDPKTERFMTIGGCGSAGELDGPLSRARFGGWGYAVFGTMAGNNKYHYMITRSKDKNSLRRFNFRKRIVEPFAKEVSVSRVTKICGFGGGIFLQSRDNLKKVSDDGKVLAEYKLSYVPGGYGESLGPYDPKNDRLYGSSREGGGSNDKNGWVVWRWDLKAGGRFEGIIGGPGNPANQPLRKQMASGPFKGSFFWCPGGLGFGPDDPDGRYPYMGGGDESNFYRLDLEKQAWLKLVPTADKKRWRFGKASGKVQAWESGGGIPWSDDGNMYPGYRGYTLFYERVK